MTSYHLEDYDFVSLSKHAKKRRVHERLLILAHVKMGKSIAQAADALFVGKPVVKRCLKNFFAKEDHCINFCILSKIECLLDNDEVYEHASQDGTTFGFC
jgi:hypothetical protein